MRYESVRVFHPSGGPILTKQSEKDMTDVNLIMASWIHAGAAVAGHTNPREGSYGDFSSGIDYHTALSAVKAADEAFMALPAATRSHVKNDAGEFLDMVYDPNRREELEKLGLVPAEKRESDSGGPLSEVLEEIRASLPKAPEEPEKAREKDPVTDKDAGA